MFCMQYLPFLPLASASVAYLYASHYSGSVYTLALNDHAGNALSIASSMVTCGGMPSWLTFDSASRTLFCSDETDTNGSVSAYAVVDGSRMLVPVAETVDVGGGVHSIVYEGEEGGYLAVAHYSGSAVSTFSLPLTSGANPLQVLRYELPNPGPHPQQDSSHPHQIILDPTGGFILVPDLGADMVYVYAIDKLSGRLDACPGLDFAPGSGPRHGLFWSASSTHGGSRGVQDQAVEETVLYTVSELGGRFDAFVISYLSSGCLGFRPTQSFIPYPGGELPEGATLAELQLAGSNLYVSVRSDHAFPPNDSLVTLIRSHDGKVAFKELTSAYGTIPRTFAINKAGTLVAIGDQTSSNVAIVARDPASGNLGDLVTSLQVGEPGQPGTLTGLSSVIWAE